FRDMSVALARAQDKLQQQTRILQSVLHNMGDGVVVADEEGRFLLFNPAAEQVLGVGMTDAAPGDWSERYNVYLPDGQTRYPPDQLPLVRALRGEAVDAVELFVRNGEATEGTWISVNARPL